MSTTTKPVSVRLSESLIKEATELNTGKRMSEIINEALRNWIAKERRLYEDDMIRRALSSMSSEQKREERELVNIAEQSSLKALEKLDE